MGKNVVKSGDWFDRMLQKFQQAVDWVEERPIPVASWVLTFLAIIFVRNFVESVSSGFNFLTADRTFFFFHHLTGFYFFSFLGLILILFLCAREKIEKVSKFVLFILPVLLLSVTIDILMGNAFGKAMETHYLEFPDYFRSGWEYFKFFFDFTFFGPYGLFFWGDPSIAQARWNYGIRLEINIILLASALYVFIKTRSILRALGAVLLVNVGLFPISFFPYLITQAAGLKNTTASLHNLSILVPSFDYNHVVFAFYFFLVVGFSTAIYFFFSREKFRSLLVNFRLFRTVNHLILFGFGVALARWSIPGSEEIGFFDAIMLVLAGFSVMFEWFSAVCYNDIQDEKGDRACMVERPLVLKTLDRSEMAFFSTFFFVLSLYVAIIVSYGLFIMMLLKACLSYAYSSSVFRLKKIPLVSNFVLALAYLFTALAGYLVVSPFGFYSFPAEVAAVILLSYTLVSPFKDIKDYEGDKIDGIRTIPVIFWLERGKKIIGVLGAVGFLLVPVILNEYFFRIAILSVIAAGIYFFLVTAKKYVESRIFFLYFTFAIAATIAINL